MANGPIWQVLWVAAALAAGALMYGAWTGPHRSVSNLSRWVGRFGVRRVPAWLERRAVEREISAGQLVHRPVLKPQALRSDLGVYTRSTPNVSAAVHASSRPVYCAAASLSVS